ncbi:MAG: single-strand binding protein single-strand DNA-binding protein [Patescibacteria group bacterium]|nr:single-strand binding protein single-strand DNA-binding protein [Patescibacteria group bacterium]
MAKSFNQAIIMGNLTRDPELRSTPGGQQVASFAVATNRTWMDASGERKEAVEYHEIVAWGKLGELAAQYLAKGRKVMAVGRLQTQSWEKDGVKRQRTEIVASDINFLDGPGGGAAGGGAAAGAGHAPASPSASKKSDDVVIQDLDSNQNINLDDIPF